MGFKFSGKNMLAKCLKVIKVSPRTCRILALFYAGLCLTGSVLLLKHRKDLVEEHNVKELISDETMRRIVFMLGQFWLISNCSMLYGVLTENVFWKKIHLYFVAGLFIGAVAIPLIFGFETFYLMIGVLDKAQTPWTDMLTQSLNYILGLILFTSLLVTILLLCIVPIHYILIGGVQPSKPISEDMKADERAKIAQEQKVVGELEKDELLA